MSQVRQSVQNYFLFRHILATMFLYSVSMKVKKENIKISSAIYNVVPHSFNLAKEIWESESIIDDIDYYIPDFLINNIFKINHKKARKDEYRK